MLALALVLAAVLPPQGLLVPHESLAGIRLGDTPAQVRKVVGTRYSVCTACKEPTWFYFAGSRETGLGVAFRRRRVAAVYTLGSPKGWRSADGLRVGRLVEKLPKRYAKVAACYGYVGRSDRSATAVTTIYLIESYVSGFALTLPSEPVCR